MLWLVLLLACFAGVAAQVNQNRTVLKIPADKFWKRAAPTIFRARFTTSSGEFVIEAHRDWAPVGVDRFYNLVDSGFFDDSRFFRVRSGYIAQFGIPGDAALAQLWRNQTIPADTPKESNARGCVAFAMVDPAARTTQLFISLIDNSKLDPQGFVPLGKVVEGMETVDKLYGGYGEDAGGGMRGGKQDKIFEGGNSYLDREFPKLDRILRARIIK